MGERGRPRCSERLRTRDCEVIDVRSMPRLPPEVPLSEHIRRVLREHFPDRPTRHDLTLTFCDGERLDVTLWTTTTRPFYGGLRRWFTCPNCGRRCAKLYAPDRRSRFACRRCWELVYRSQYVKDPALILVNRWLLNPPKMTSSAVRQRAARLRKKLEAKRLPGGAGRIKAYRPEYRPAL